MDRRTLLTGSGAMLVAGALAPLVGPGPEAAYAARADTGVSVYAFPLSAVTLQAGPFLDNMNPHPGLPVLRRCRPAALQLPGQRRHRDLGATGRRMGVTDHRTARPLGRHLLSALAQAYGNTRNATYQAKGDTLVNALASCQAASPSRGFHTGYLSAFPENFFDRLESGQTVWAPYYCIHKILAGLLDVWRHTATPRPDRAPGPRRMGGHPDRAPVHQPDAGHAGHRVRRHERRAHRPVPDDRGLPLADGRTAFRPRRDLRPARRRPGPARRQCTPTRRSQDASARSASTTRPGPPGTGTSPPTSGPSVNGPHVRQRLQQPRPSTSVAGRHRARS